MLLCDWDRVLMIHYEVEPEALAPLVPFPLDLHEGRAHVSLVAFSMRRMRFRRAPWLRSLISTHPFLNVRTYVKGGIYFLAEWLPNRLSVVLGPRLYGLPYRLGRLEYLHQHEHGLLHGRVAACDAPGRLVYNVPIDPFARFQPCGRGTLDEFLMERYVAYTQRGRERRLFRVAHEPWPQARVEIEVVEDSLLAATGGWRRRARLLGANYSPGLRDVVMGAPERVCLEPRTTAFPATLYT